MKTINERTLKVAITKAKNKMTSAKSLEEKIELSKEVKKAELMLRNFNLNYFDIEDIKASNASDVNSKIMALIGV
jgi:hypothetical protein